jgi:hypothetical protein
MTSKPATAKDAAYYANVWARQMPNLAARLQRAIPLVGGVSPGPRPNTYKVVGATGNYVVETFRTDTGGLNTACTCPDNRKNGQRCKHSLAAALAVKLGQVGAPV